ncbi:hypothetical protein G7Y89_g1699 [Cudoniella acicularis]|uniref:Glutamine amidotransferase domain-containing protein n=1 Tax=Cudoniella acicularis TaxID=354080 RepID=A0A8H4WA13_9HELO|nr:hypothetical protein G7Y89_g1699 [Cudoniella acicularis]
MAQTRHKSALEKLPAETLQAIMIAIADAASLPALLLSSITIYQAFKSAETTIVNKLLLNEFGQDALPHAIAEFQSSGLKIKTRKDLKKFADEHYSKEGPFVQINTLYPAVCISKRKFVVKYFTTKFIESALGHRPPSHLPVSLAESARFERSFYLFEVYCNLFRNYESRDDNPYTKMDTREPMDSDQRAQYEHDLFLGNFSPWERNQIAFEEVSHHDLEFGAHPDQHGSMFFGCMPPRFDTEQILSRGLADIYEIATATTYAQQRHALMRVCQPRQGVPNNHLSSLLSIKLNCKNTIYQDDADFLLHPYFSDPDPGPEQVWRWANELYDARENGLTLGGGSPDHREWAYVMWDYARLEKWGMFDPIPPPPAPLTLSPEEYQYQLEVLEEMGKKRLLLARRDQKKWERKYQIIRAGGTGWWSFEDESKVVWERGSPLDDEVKRRECGKEMREQVKGKDGLRQCRSHLRTIGYPIPFPKTIGYPFSSSRNSVHLLALLIRQAYQTVDIHIQKTLNIAVLDCDIPVPNVYAERGQYSDIFAALLRDAAATSQELSQLSLKFKQYDTVRGDLPSRSDLNDLDAIIITGSASSAYDNELWIKSLADFCRVLYNSYLNIKIFGSCFGHQILCHALFSATGKNVVGRNPKGWELGVQPINISPSFLRQFGPVTSNPENSHQLRLQFVHADHVTMSAFPEGFYSIGSSSHCAFQGVWQKGRVLTYQGHAEFDRFVNSETLKVFGKPTWEKAFLAEALTMVDQEDDAIWAATVMLKFFLEDTVEDMEDMEDMPIDRSVNVGEDNGIVLQVYSITPTPVPNTKTSNKAFSDLLVHSVAAAYLLPDFVARFELGVEVILAPEEVTEAPDAAFEVAVAWTLGHDTGFTNARHDDS